MLQNNSSMPEVLVLRLLTAWFVLFRKLHNDAASTAKVIWKRIIWKITEQLALTVII
jgi:hypothetical protein